MNRMGFGWVFAILIAGAGWTEAVGAEDGEVVWAVKSSVSNRS